MAEIKGGCLCGAVRYSVDAGPTFMANCHCDDCRKSSAAGHMSLIGVPAENIAFEGQVSQYEIAAESGATVTHHFCPICGSQLYNKTTNNPDGVAVVAATLDDPDIFSPQVSVYASKAMPWDPPKEGVPQFEKMPPRS